MVKFSISFIWEKQKKKSPKRKKTRAGRESVFLDGLISSVGPEADIIAGLHVFEVNMRRALSAEKTRIWDILLIVAIL